MQIPILIEPVAGIGYRARSGEPIPLSAEAATQDEAVSKLREQVTRRLQNGTSLIAIEIVPTNPWLEMAGMLDPADPLIQDWKRAIAEYREEVDIDPNYL